MGLKEQLKRLERRLEQQPGAEDCQRCNDEFDAVLRDVYGVERTPNIVRIKHTRAQCEKLRTDIEKIYGDNSPDGGLADDLRFAA